MKSRTNVFWGVLVLMVTSASLLFAQHNHSGSQELGPEKMQECQMHHSEISALVDQASQTLAEGREQSNPEAMRAALDKVQVQLGEIKRHMSMCPMAKAGTTQESGGHTNRRKCMSGQQGQGTDRRD
jgi:hypothetical protein